MECDECGATKARPRTVKLADGSTDLLKLCDDCVEEFRAAGLVKEVVDRGTQ